VSSNGETQVGSSEGYRADRYIREGNRKCLISSSDPVMGTSSDFFPKRTNISDFQKIRN
jgi:hypothetical protein